ncbi:hypothetical protein UFOVP1492_42 [uncultured Caudovirales phage]|uniref:Uncharacterized protein n=1 Tax=uncultured Caudovirales phage TaxID=2100421 RepID=A0A6J5SPZ3_9CAUD|nr:hypothetical protein UFOVP1127_92 [uncultured Caudovirales phage]CAB4193633.1 hypothetical protein UFOVP1242_118 [uncultured Caudovirales phage]CAB4217548.1 hypothetical protein UFOVP1492_42 [uncultured Caudovirales phage]CAB5231387.1 hypothetical protein UFOVP1580_71 [uncultured Caudovirales phage]
MSERVKRIYDSKTEAQVAHHWAHQSLPRNIKDHFEASNASRNFYYSGTIIYSYGRHYPIADLLPDKKGHPKTVLFEAVPYPSQQTHGHRGMVKSAIPSDWQIIEVVMGKDYWSPSGPDIPGNLEFYFNKVTELAKLQARARTRDYSPEINRWGKEAKKFIAYFKPKKALYKKYLEAYNASETFTASVASSLVEETAKQRERRKERQQEAVETLVGWYAGVASDNALSCVLKDYSDVRLRRDGEMIYTSKGFRVDLQQSKSLFRLMHSKKAHLLEVTPEEGVVDSSGTSWKISRLNADGSLIVGCHNVSYEEAEALAVREGWIKSEEMLTSAATLKSRMLGHAELYQPTHES